ncbi:MAG TPA: ACP S-malonyltransferase [Acidimicrobiales bacterium]|jgi:[acyl-carrier-protein] S-malonyltransferase|nr:ACP S-malonyltransferase [Acidimicrobiales bacterium]
MGIGLVFPGQGSQFVGMVDAWLAHPAAAAVIEEANAVFGEDLAAMGRDEKALARTDVVQPVTLACELAAFRVLSDKGVDVAVAAGHSLGEFAALAAAGVITTAGAFDTVRVRSRAMQAASDSGEGAMMAIVGMSPEDAAAICAEAAQGDVLLVANENSPVQTVLSGSAEAIGRAEELARERKARAIRLPLPGAFHSPLMEPARQEVEAAIGRLDFAEPRFPVIPNATGQPTTDPDALRDALLVHLVSPVHWIDTMQAMQGLGVSKLVEAGPGSVLTKLAKRCVPDLEAVSASTPEEAEAAA